MKKIKYYIASLLFMASCGLGMTSCSDDKLGETIFPDVEDTLDPSSYTYKLDKFIQENYMNVYNMQFLYKMADISTNMNYNLVPAQYEHAVDLAVLCKHLWFDAYDEVCGPDFLKQYGPRIILLIGSPAIDATSGTEIVGLAEGSVKISLFKVNDMDITNFAMMNEYYFHTMHHEFSHILHQTKTYPTAFNRLSVGLYDSNNWQGRHTGQVASLGFVSTYASKSYTEDLAETYATYVTATEEDWAEIYDLASRGWASSAEDDVTADFYCYYYYPDNNPDNELVYLSENNVFTETDSAGVVHKYWRQNRDAEGNRIVVYDVEDTDGIDGVEIIEQKIQVIRQWLADVFGVDLDKIREEVQTRQSTYDIEELRKWVYNIE